MKTWVKVVFSSHLYQQSFKQTDKKATLKKCIFQVFVAIFLRIFFCVSLGRDQSLLLHSKLWKKWNIIPFQLFATRKLNRERLTEVQLLADCVARKLFIRESENVCDVKRASPRKPVNLLYILHTFNWNNQVSLAIFRDYRINLGSYILSTEWQFIR